MLLDKEVEILLTSGNIKYYEEKGYFIPRRKDTRGQMSVQRGTKIIVKIEDLTNNSHVKVNVKCDNPDCKNPHLKPMTLQAYKTYIRENDKYYCRNCAIKLFGVENIKNAFLKNSESFYDWCIENNRRDILDRWNCELNNKKPNEICYCSGLKYWFKCPKGIHKSELKLISSFTSGQNGTMDCKQCNSFAQWGINNLGKDFLEKYWDYEKNKNVDPWEISYGGSNKKIYIKCQEKDYHGSYQTSCNEFINNKRCPYCNRNSGKVHLLDSLGKLLEDRNLLYLWSDKNKKSPYEYAPKSHTKVRWRCPERKHSDFKRSIISSNKADFHCSECVQERNESFLQEKVRLYLESLGYIVLHENKCTIVPINPKSKWRNNTLPFDNEIKELKLIIEVNGKQHYEEINGKWFDENFDLHKRQLYDRYKRMYAKSQGYNYLEIPYWTDDSCNNWKKLIDNKIDEILNKCLKKIS